MDDVNARQQWIDSTIAFVRTALSPASDAATKREAALVCINVATMLDPTLATAAAPPPPPAASSTTTPPPSSKADMLDQLIARLQGALDKDGAAVPYTGRWPWPQRG